MPSVKFIQTRDLLQSGDLLTTPLLALAIDRYGTECLEWLTETLQLELQDEFNCQLPALTVDRLGVGGQLLTTDLFYHSLPDFISFCNVLSGTPYDPELWDPADSGEAAWGITEALLLDPPDDENPFSEEILLYLGAALDAEGILTPPDVLRIAVRRSDPLTIVADYSDDPEMFNSLYQFESGKTQDIEQMLHRELGRLVQQLRQLDLHVGHVDQALSRFSKALPSQPSTSRLPGRD